MISLPRFLLVMHLIGLSLGIGAATVKVLLLVRARTDLTLVPAYLRIVRSLTQLIVLGLILLTATGIVWLILGYVITPVLVIKMILVGALWVIGPIIDNVAEPAFRRFAPAASEAASPEFLQARGQYFLLEVIGTVMFYAVVILWVLRPPS